MSYIARHVLEIVTDSSGDATAFTPHVDGIIQAIRYIDGDFDTGGTITITADKSGLDVLAVANTSADGTYYPRAAAQNTTAGELNYGSATGAPIPTGIPVAGESLKVVVANGGDSASGTLHFYVEGR